MDKIKEFWEKLTSNPIAKMAVIVMGVFLLIIIFVMIIASCSSNTKTYEYDELEQKLVDLAKKYYSKEDKLPEKDEYKEIAVNMFVNDGYMKEYEKITKDNVDCSGSIKIFNNNGYYAYIPEIECGSKYKSVSLYDKLLEDSLTESGNGLYEDGEEYVFRGDNVNNFVKLNDEDFRVLKINEDGTIRVISLKRIRTVAWDNRYNNETNKDDGINDYYRDGLNSIIKDNIESVYQSDEYFTPEVKGYFVSKEQCVGKRDLNNIDISSNVECSVLLDAEPFTLIQANEYYNASLDKNCTNESTNSNCKNYNYLVANGNGAIGTTWTITADAATSNNAFILTSSGLNLKKIRLASNFRIVTTFNKEITITGGTGTFTDPYIINQYVK